jgi:hypothetical protein
LGDFVAATFRLRNLREIHIHPSDVEKRPPGPSATMAYNIKSLNLARENDSPVYVKVCEDYFDALDSVLTSIEINSWQETVSSDYDI